jgi:hypothetical protein
MMHELAIDELDHVAGGKADVSLQTITSCGGGCFLIVSTTTHYTDQGNYTTTSAHWDDGKGK